MPYVENTLRLKLNEVVFLMSAEKIRTDDLSNLLFDFCKEYVRPSYNNYKNFIGELRQCAAEIERRRLASTKWFCFKIRPEMAKKAIERVIKFMAESEIKADGDLNYILFKFCKYHTGGRRKFVKMLKNCALRIEAELLAPYEDFKIVANGDV